MKRAALDPIYRTVNSYTELYTLVKYRFLLATEVTLFGFDHSFVPVSQTFVHHLTNFRTKYAFKTSIAGSSTSSEFGREDIPLRSFRMSDHRRQPGYDTRSVVARRQEVSNRYIVLSDYGLSDDEQAEYETA